jgi:hypothetical protein
MRQDGRRRGRRANEAMDCDLAVTSEDVRQYRKRAEEARRFSEKSINSIDKEVWLRVAIEWFKLAQGASLKKDPT